MMTVDTGSAGQVLELARLARAPLHDELEGFVEGYAGWIEAQRHRAGGVRNVHEQAAARRICDRMAVALKRMRRCVELLRSDPLAARSFQLANRAMLDQMRQADEDGGETEARVFRWRPFQLAVLLTVMESTIREEDDFRDVLDLIWFPTGGGKTEAYLGLVAFLIAWRRLKHPDTGGGTVALMRYTLRLLTRQQFERAVRIIFALELIRRGDPSLGEDPITAGIWVGGRCRLAVAESHAGCVASSIHAVVVDCDAPAAGSSKVSASAPVRRHSGSCPTPRSARRAQSHLRYTKMANNRCFVQFPHPGKEHKLATGCAWHMRKRAHMRKFMQLHGEWIEGDDTRRSGTLWAWGEWEPESDLIRQFRSPGGDSLYPRYLWDPYYVPKRSYRGLHNTDPIHLRGAFPLFELWSGKPKQGWPEAPGPRLGDRIREQQEHQRRTEVDARYRARSQGLR